MANRTQLEDCRRSRKLDAEYNRTVISNLSAENAMLREALDRAVQDIEAGWNLNDARETFPWLDSARSALAKGE